MVSFIASLIVTAVLIAILARFAVRRAPGTPLTWGEAFVAATFMFALMLMIYGVVPDQWLRWADGGLKWRSDKLGIPVGPIPIGGKNHLILENGIHFGDRARILLTAQVLRDVIAAGIYIVFLVLQCIGWIWWQNRGKKPARPAIETSSYGRPLLRRAESTTASAEA